MPSSRKFYFILCFLFLVPLFFCGNLARAFNIGNPEGFVSDFAEILSLTDKSALEQKLTTFEKETSNEISVVTVPDLQGDVIENVAVEIFEKWGIGKKKNDNGILLLIALNDRKMRIEVGYGLEGALPDASAGSIIDNDLKPAFRANNYYQGIDSAVNNMMKATRGEYTAEETSASSEDEIVGYFWLFLILFMWISSMLARSKSWWAGGVVGGGIGLIIGIFKGFLFFGLITVGVLVPLGLLFDYIISKNYKKAIDSGRKPPWWTGGGGFGSGGHSGGGFGGFGGGHSGGGGASGSW